MIKILEQYINPEYVYRLISNYKDKPYVVGMLIGDMLIILLHDAGGDRRQTVEALPQILAYLQARGDSIVSLSTLLGTTRDALMPPIQTAGRSLNHFVSGAGFTIFHAAEEFLWAFMIVATALVVLRTLTVIWLAARFRRSWSESFQRASHL